MVQAHDWKLVHCFDQPWGELYDLQKDPAEVCNRWNGPACAEVKAELLAILRDWLIRDTV